MPDEATNLLLIILATIAGSGVVLWHWGREYRDVTLAGTAMLSVIVITLLCMYA